MSETALLLPVFHEPDEFADELSTGEKRLWCAVIASSCFEYEEWLQRIESEWTRTSRPVAKIFLLTLAQVRRQMQTEWFRNICDMADISHSLIMRKLQSLDREYCLHSIPVGKSDDRMFDSEWSLRASSKRPAKRRIFN